MRTLLFITIVLLFVFTSPAQSQNGDNAKYSNSSIQLRYNEKGDILKHIVLKKSYEVSEHEQKYWLKNILQLSSDYQLQQVSETTDPLGYTHYKYQIKYQGYRLENSLYTAHCKNSKIVSASGDYILVDNFNGEIKVSAQKAFDIAVDYSDVKSIVKKVNNTYNSPELVIINIENESLLCYKCDIYSYEPLSRRYIYVDVSSAKVVKSINNLSTVDTQALAETLYSGIQNMTTDSVAGYFRLRENGRGGGIQTLNLNNGVEYSTATDFTDADNYWDTQSNGDRAAHDVHYGSESSFDFFYDVYGLNSFDNAEAPINNYVHFATNENNAWWDGDKFTFGDGDSIKFTHLTSLDIVAHEYTHAVTGATAGLINADEPGALNESFSDIFAVAVDYYKNSTDANFMIGEQVSPIGLPMRNFYDPNSVMHPDTYKGYLWDSTGFDNGGVHINCAVQNYWFWLLCNGGNGMNDNGHNWSVDSIAMQNALDIVYRTLSVYLTPMSEYSDARYYSIESAKDLYGECSQEVVSVTNAWHAVGVGNPYSNMILSDFSVNANYFCSFPAEAIFTNESLNGTNYLWDFGDGTTDTTANPIHSYSETGVYSVKLITTGLTTCDTIDSIAKVNYITISDDGGPVPVECTPESGSPLAQIGIHNFSFNTINNSSGNATEGYRDFTCEKRTTVTQGEKYNFLITTSESTPEDVLIWMDLDNDALFYNLTESILWSNNNYHYHTGEITIPDSLPLNIPLRLRVIDDFAGYPIDTACATPTYGQVEDYSFIVIQDSLAPVASFNYTVIDECNGIISFNDLSGTSPDSWLWDFGDGGIDTSQNPAHQYNSSGLHNVTLTASGAGGSCTQTTPIVIFPFLGSIIMPDSALIEEDITFSAEATDQITQYYWDFGDETFSDLENPVHVYDSAGYYGITLILTSNEGCSDTISTYLLVENYDNNQSFEQVPDISIFPNPSNGIFRINTNGIPAEVIQIEVYDIFGQRVFNDQTLISHESNYTVNINSCSSGIYLVKLYTNKYSFCKKIIMRSDIMQ